MASWKRLTDTSNMHVEVNMDQVCFMRQMPNYTELHFGTQILMVKESASAIGGMSGHAYRAAA
jgi:hypothetical protein